MNTPRRFPSLCEPLEKRTLLTAYSAPVGPLIDGGSVSPFITVTSFPTTVSGMTVTFTGVNHLRPDDLDIMLVSPTGQTVMIWSDAGGAVPLSSVNVTLSDAAASSLPDSVPPITTGTYKPANYETSDPGFLPPTGTTLAHFDGIDPNGTWNVLISDDTSGPGGPRSITQVSLDFPLGDVTPPTITAQSPSPSGSIVGTSQDIDVTFSEPVTGVDATDLVLSGAAAASAVKGTPTNIGGNTWRFPVSGLVAGALNATLAPDANDIEDSAGNDLASSSWSYQVYTTLYVDPSSPGPTHDGLSWNAAYLDLQSALAASSAGMEIHVADGTYKPSDIGRAATFTLKSGVKVYGGYAGYGAPDPDERNVNFYTTTLSGDIGTPDYWYDNSYHVVTGTGTNSDTLLSGFTVYGGRADGSGEDTKGAAFYAPTGMPAVSQCKFTFNLATAAGGAMYVRTANLSSCQFTGNTAFPTSGGDADGGALYIIGDAGPSQISHTLFDENDLLASGEASGGAIFVAGGALDVIYSTFIDNKVVANTFAAGGAIAIEFGDLSVTSSQFLGNSADDVGGAFFLDGASLLATNCTFVGNRGTGSVVFDYLGDDARLVNSTIFAAPVDPPFIAVASEGYSTVDLDNCVVQAAAPLTLDTFETTVRYSTVFGGAPGIGNVNAQAKFFRTPSPGADNMWATNDDDYGDLRLRADSPGIDAGSNSLVTPGVATDVTGFNARVVNLPGVNDPGAIVDTGAYEHSAGSTVPGQTSGADTYYIRVSPDKYFIQVWLAATPSGNPTYTYYVGYCDMLVFDTGAGADKLIVDASNGTEGLPDLSFQAGSDNDTLTFKGTAASTDLAITSTGATLDGVSIFASGREFNSLDGPTSSAVLLDSLVLTSNLSLPEGKQLVLSLKHIEIDGPGGWLDLTDNDLAVDYTNPTNPAAEIEWLVGTGYNGGDWLGNGITSSTAAGDSNFHLAVADNAILSQPFGTAQGGGLFSGVDVDDTCVLVKFTHRTDLNLDGLVTDSDAITFSTNFEPGANAVWAIGDLDMDGIFSDNDAILFSTFYDTNLPQI